MEISKDDLVDKTIGGKYRLLCCVSTGSTKVYVTMIEHLNKVFAVKVYSKNLPLDEIRAIYKIQMGLDHPGIPRIYEILEDEDYLYIVQEYLQGTSLSETVQHYGPVSPEMAIDWAAQICEALDYLHTQRPPLFYYDLDPTNIIVQPDGAVKLLCSGKLRQGSSGKMPPPISAGYAAPECIAYGTVDARTDIFSMGMLLHYLVTAVDPSQPPYEVKPIREIDPSLSWELELIIERCIQRDPKARFPSCKVLAAVLRGEPDPTKPKKGPLRKFFDRIILNLIMLKRYNRSQKRQKEKGYMPWK